MRVFAVIPVFNEQDWILRVVKGALEYVQDVIVVDDGSSKQYLQWVEQLPANAHFVRHSINLGKGAALKTGCDFAVRAGADVVVLMDGDGQHLASDIPKLLAPIANDGKDIVFGSRTIGRDMPLVMMIGNKVLSLACSFLFGTYISDTQSGFRAFRLSVYDQLRWNTPRYAAETEMLVRASRGKLQIDEVQVATVYHDSYKGTTVIDGIRIFFEILKWRFL